MIPEEVAVKIEGQTVRVEGPKGALSHVLPTGIQAALEGQTLTLARAHERQDARALHGLSRALVQNMVLGVTRGFSKELEIQGVGFRAQVEKGVLTLSLGKTHPVTYRIPQAVTVSAPKPTQIIIQGMDKGVVGQVAATIRAFYPPEPYKGVGIRYVGEVVRRKAGKAVATKTGGA